MVSDATLRATQSPERLMAVSAVAVPWLLALLSSACHVSVAAKLLIQQASQRKARCIGLCTVSGGPYPQRLWINYCPFDWRDITARYPRMPFTSDDH